MKQIEKFTLLKVSATLVILCILIIFAVVSGQENIQVISQPTGDTLGYLPSLEIGSQSFVTASKFANVLGVPFSSDPLLKKFTFKLSGNSITIFAISPYIQTNKKILQLPVQTYYRHEEYYIPLRYFLENISDLLPFTVNYVESEKKLYIQPSRANIVGIIIDEKENGILIHVSTTQKIQIENVYTSSSNGWFYVDVFSGSIDTLQSFQVQNTSRTVKKVIPIQLSAQTARLSFQISSTILEKNISLNDNPTEVLVSLRTNEKIRDGLISELEREKEKWKIDTIVIDPGHGGQDPGAIGRNGTFEKKITLEIAKEIKQELERRLSIKVIMTRSRDSFLALKSRTHFANQNGGKLFISIHADSNPRRDLQGHTVYFMGPAKTDEARLAAQSENSAIRFEDSQNHYQDISDASFILAANAQNSYNKESQEFAALIDSELKKELKVDGNGVRQAGFYVLYGASMPNVLIETGFISNRTEEQELQNKNRQLTIARAVCNSIIKLKSLYEDE